MTGAIVQPSLPCWRRDIYLFDGLEIHPVKEYPVHVHTQDSNAGRQTFCEPCEPHEADFWSVYGHLVTGGIECFADFSTLEAAEDFTRELRITYPHLADV
jgi:hypothetical protein